MVPSSGCFESGLERCSAVYNGPEDIHPPACEGKDGLVVPFSFAALSFVEGAAVLVGEGAECGLVEDALETLVASAGTPQEACPPGLSQHRGNAGGGSKSIGRAEAGEISCLGDEFCGEHGPHAWQATDEGRVRVAGQHCLQFAVELNETGAAGERLDGKLAHQTCSHTLSRNRDGLLGGGGECPVGQGLHIGQAARGLQMARDALAASVTQFGRSDELGQQVQRPLGFEIETGLQPRKDADEQVAHARQALGLRLHDVATTADQQADLEVEFSGWLDRSQVRPGPDLVGDGTGIARVGLVLAADGPLAGAIDGDARQRLEDVQVTLAGVWWQTALIVFALIVLAPLGEEILFRALELRGLVRLIPFAVAAPISGLLFTAAHYDAWVAWPRTLALVATGWALAWLYRWRGIPATITAHATVNTVAAIALIIQS